MSAVEAARQARRRRPRLGPSERKVSRFLPEGCRRIRTNPTVALAETDRIARNAIFVWARAQYTVLEDGYPEHIIVTLANPTRDWHESSHHAHQQLDDADAWFAWWTQAMRSTYGDTYDVDEIIAKREPS